MINNPHLLSDSTALTAYWLSLESWQKQATQPLRPRDDNTVPPSLLFSLQAAAFNEYEFLYRVGFDYPNLQAEYTNEARPFTSKALTNHIDYEYGNEAGNPIPLRAKYIYVPGDLGCITALPENCYPPTSPELEIISIQTEHNIEVPLLLLSESTLDEIEAACWKDAEQPGWDYDYD